MREKQPGLHQKIQWLGLVAGPVAAAIVYRALPDEFHLSTDKLVPFSHAGRVTLAVMVWMATWWLTEALHISITALLPLLLFPILGAAQGNSATEQMKDAAAPYADPMVFLFMGGFIVALSMQRWGLDRRFALMTLRLVGSKPANMVGGVMLATAVLSAFVSNTATTAMMLPIALSVIALVRRQMENPDQSENKNPEINQQSSQSNFALCMLLGLAYSASIGGLATIIGTPTNTFAVGFIRDEYEKEISFLEWLSIGLPIAVVFLPLVWLLLTRFIYPVPIRKIKDGKSLIRDELASLGPTKRGEWITFAVFACTATCWICRRWLTQIELSVGGDAIKPFGGLTDTGIAIAAAIALFVIPVNLRKREFTMDWPTAQKLPWGILLLFGGGLSLAQAVKTNGVAEFIGAQASHFAGMPAIVLVLVVTTAVIFLTELTSNTPTTATLLPVLAALAPALGIHPYLLIFPATLSASCAFMMPVATPPNAIVFGSGELTIPQMVKAGWWLNLIGIVLVTAFAMLLLGPILGLKF